MTSDRNFLFSVAALWLLLAPLDSSLAFEVADLAKLRQTGSCVGCNLSGADLYEADLFKADLSRANLRDADLTDADLTLANLSEADVRGTVFEGTNLSGTQLKDIKLSENGLIGAIYDSERTRTDYGFKELNLGMNLFEVEQYCSITDVQGKASDPGNAAAFNVDKFIGKCFDDEDVVFAFGFSSEGASGLLDFLQVDFGSFTEEDHQKYASLLAEKYTAERSYTEQDVTLFNKDRGVDGKSLDTVFADGQVTLSVASRETGLRLFLTYREESEGRRFLDRKGGSQPIDLTDLPRITTDLYKFVGNYRLEGINREGTEKNNSQIDLAYLEIDAFGNEIAGEIAVSGQGMNARLQITGIREISETQLKVELRPVNQSLPDERLLTMFLQFSEDGNSLHGHWVNWFALQDGNDRKIDDFQGARSQTLWSTVMRHNRIDMYEAYLRLRPGGVYAAVARSRIAELNHQLQAISTTTTTISSASHTDPAANIETIATKTIPVHPLVGIWREKNVKWFDIRCYLAVAINQEGQLVGKSWEFNEHTGNGFPLYGPDRQIKITQENDLEFTWESETSLPANPGHVSFRVRGVDSSGGINILTDKPQEIVADNLCREAQATPEKEILEKVPFEESLALELPKNLLEGIPSPFVTGKITVEAPSTTQASTVAALATATAPEPAAKTIPVHPLVGIWEEKSASTYDAQCFVAIAVNDEGKLVGKSWERNTWNTSRMPEIGGIRDIKISEVSQLQYVWNSDQALAPIIDLSSAGIVRAVKNSGRLNVEDEGFTKASASNLCREPSGSPEIESLNKLPLEEALALGLPDELLLGFPSPFMVNDQDAAAGPTQTSSNSGQSTTQNLTQTESGEPISQNRR